MKEGRKPLATSFRKLNSSCPIQHHTTPHHTTPHHTTPHHTSHHTTSHHTTPHNTTPHNTTPHNTTPHNTTQHNTTPHHTTPHHTTPHRFYGFEVTDTHGSPCFTSTHSKGHWTSLSSLFLRQEYCLCLNCQGKKKVSNILFNLQRKWRRSSTFSLLTPRGEDHLRDYS